MLRDLFPGFLTLFLQLDSVGRRMKVRIEKLPVEHQQPNDRSEDRTEAKAANVLKAGALRA